MKNNQEISLSEFSHTQQAISINGSQEDQIQQPLIEKQQYDNNQKELLNPQSQFTEPETCWQNFTRRVKGPANMFFLVIAITQFIPMFKVGLLFTFVAPLALVLFMTMLKEGYEDYKRFKRDQQANSKYYKIASTNGLVDRKSSDLKVGNIVQVNGNERVPADLLLLCCDDINEDVFIKTDQMDGETDWKLRKPVRFAQNLYKQNGVQVIVDYQSQVICAQPIENIYKFEGIFQHESTKESLSLENTLWANTVLASGRIYGLVLYTGRETRMAMNSRQSKSKFGKLDNEINFLSKLCFAILAFGCVIMLLASGFQVPGNQVIILFRYLVLLNSIIPISLRVNLDFAKLLYCYYINQDKLIDGTIARSSQIPEELGRIQYLLTDKTGTLTQNEMIFKRISLENGVYTSEDQSTLQEIIKKECSQKTGPMHDKFQYLLQAHSEEQQQQQSNIDLNINPQMTLKKQRRDKDAIIRDLITSLALCHNVTPIYSDEDNQSKSYQASSPDEIALVKLAESMGIKLHKRTQKLMTIKVPSSLQNNEEKEENYEILTNFPFSSESKRMGIVVKHLETQRYIFYLKGADTVMKEKIPEYQRGFLMEECENLAREGLRTLVITQKLITEEFYNQWNKMYQEAKTSMSNRELLEKQAILKLEEGMEFLGVTGVEDKLQEEVCQTLENLRGAGINVWMLTGDKIETAICIAISAGIKSVQQSLYQIKEVEDPDKLTSCLMQFKQQQNSVLVIDGNSLKVALSSCKEVFFNAACKAPAVVCCRCSPTQKAEITENIRKITGKITAGIGDGGNDVGMIQSANVGIGIVGKEGMQAALAADFSILKFKYLQNLLLWHGRLSYKRSAVLSQFVIHRGLVISFIQMIFTICYNFIPLPVYNGYLTLGYATVFTMLPVFSLVLDEDVDLKTAIVYPQLYKTLQNGRELNSKTFLVWLLISIYQATVIMVMGFVLFNKLFLQVQTITFTALIFSEILNICTSLNKVNKIQITTQVISLALYIAICCVLKSQLFLGNVNLVAFLSLICITIMSWLPPFIIKIIRKRVQPNDYEKIMKYRK